MYQYCELPVSTTEMCDLLQSGPQGRRSPSRLSGGEGAEFSLDKQTTFRTHIHTYGHAHRAPN